MAVRCNHERGVTQATTKEMKKGNILTAAEKTKNAVWRQSTRSSARGKGLEPQSSYTRNKTWLPWKVRCSSADRQPSKKWINDLTR